MPEYWRMIPSNKKEREEKIMTNPKTFSTIRRGGNRPFRSPHTPEGRCGVRRRGCGSFAGLGARLTVPVSSRRVIPIPTFSCSTRSASRPRSGNTTIKRLYTGCLWAEGPPGTRKASIWSGATSRPTAAPLVSTMTATSPSSSTSRPTRRTATASISKAGRSPPSAPA